MPPCQAYPRLSLLPTPISGQAHPSPTPAPRPTLLSHPSSSSFTQGLPLAQPPLGPTPSPGPSPPPRQPQPRPTLSLTLYQRRRRAYIPSFSSSSSTALGPPQLIRNNPFSRAFPFYHTPPLHPRQPGPSLFSHTTTLTLGQAYSPSLLLDYTLYYPPPRSSSHPPPLLPWLLCYHPTSLPLPPPSHLVIGWEGAIVVKAKGGKGGRGYCHL